ncbi:hypothetical protein [[Mycobacterium] holstebronense]|uniref:Serine/threonine protein kinase n=1 Tax=[Mycobacterium] holstebronense TaxID=3064288 RepID=A0ABN9MXQ3_9MYCO|nr:hypothetical protein [Mycolicibacter sp. MU0102]CAJ1496920.1 hypothetical protein MU0102_000338 [Mycolicibacter sp. MU0102]
MPSAQRGPQPPGPPPAPFGPANPGRNPGYEAGNAPTQYAPYNTFDEPTDPQGTDFAALSSTPWFRRRSVLIAWFGLIAVMLAVVVWGIIQLTSRGPGGGTTPATSSSSSSTSSSTTSSSSAPSTTAPTAAPPRQAPPQQPPAQQAPPASEPPHRHLPHLPSVITIPPIPKVPELPTVITLPPRR